ncbi:SDR family NAD(P)-dependent oxidoreductase [Vibrio sp. ER1A]|uniref:SDR family NAD(P)-dependent oxidoreductase n=1 Tax=Vibrio sp. ER1A TaxID=1517681 RepID=UPI0004DD8C81|nr:SDR family NAD(P)-dependent oxidoreductase [Vibrio sp. ER1A]KFA95995.1 short-chain dehydrogenase [Vibrio sp. ER1A]
MAHSHQSVFITGASSGIGWQLANDYAEQGYLVYACGRSKEKLQSLQAGRENIVPLSFDVTDREAVAQAFSKMEQHPTLWIVNAGDCEYIDEGLIDAALIERVMAVNVMGTVNVLEQMQTRLKSGHHVVVVSSIAGELALPRAEAYGASKAAITYLVRTLQLDWKNKGVAISCVFPGFVKTPLTDKNDFDMPMMVSVEEASNAIQTGIDKRSAYIYFPKRFTWILRLVGIMPYGLQTKLVTRLLNQS